MKTKIALCLLPLAMLFYSCMTNPVTGKKELSLLSYDKELQLGAEADKSIVAQYGLYDDPKIAAFLTDLGTRMARISHRPNLEFHFRLLDSPVVNAFALPGGYVYITRGILAYMNSEAELAGVLGHEIGHVTARHGAKAYTRAQLAQFGFTAGYLFSQTFRQVSDLAQLGVGLLFLRFSRDQERQSDQLGVEYSTKVGYDATNMAHFFGTLNRLQQESGQSLPAWFSTHPNPVDREKRVLQLAKEAQQKSTLRHFATRRGPYLSLIDGIVFGEDPRQGFVENGTFYHPQLLFQFPVPTGWVVNNTPQVVQIINKNKSAGIEFTLAKQASARAAADKFVLDSGAKVLFSDRRKINGFPAEIRESLVTSQNREMKVLSYFIEKGRRVYVFHGFASVANYSKNRSSFKYTMENFDRLRNEKARHVKPTRVKVVRVTKTTSLKRFLARYPSKQLSAEKLAIINGRHLTDTLKPGERIKVLTK